MRRLTIAASVLALTGGLALTGCSSGDDSSQTREAKARQGSYDNLTRGQPAKSMTYSPTRETINNWVTTWSKPGKLSYVYIQNAKGEYGYFILKGLPVSYCAMLTPSYELKDVGGDGDSSPDFQVPAPGMDGAYYSGNQCNAYYGNDATTGAYLEFTIGANQSFFLYDEPMTLPEFKDASPLGPTTVADVKKS